MDPFWGHELLDMIHCSNSLKSYVQPAQVFNYRKSFMAKRAQSGFSLQNHYVLSLTDKVEQRLFFKCIAPTSVSHQQQVATSHSRWVHKLITSLSRSAPTQQLGIHVRPKVSRWHDIVKCINVVYLIYLIMIPS